MWRNAAVFVVCYILAVTLGVFAGANLVAFALPALPLFVLAWLALALDRDSWIAQAAPVPEPPPQRRRHEPALDRIAELADVGVVQMSRDGTLEFASRRARELLGFESEAAESEHWPAIAQAIRRRSDPNETSGGIYEVEAASGARLLNFKIHPVYEEEWTGYLVQIRDRRALAALESDLRTAARQRALNQVFVGIAHDARGALNAAVLNLESLKMEAEEQSLESGLLVRIAVVRDELDRLHRTLEMLLGETVSEEVQRQNFDLEDAVRAVSALLETKALQQGVGISCSRGGWARVSARPDRIREAVLILAINALESMPGGGSLRFVTGNSDGWAHLEVMDTGSGIGADVLPRIFELHYTTKPQGTGVGLWAARSIVESERGQLDVATTGIEGTTFRLSLPLVKES